MSAEELLFTVDSALLKELGERLVESVNIALVELIKNSYDADATEVYVRFIKNPQGHGPTIEIEDNGIGMNHSEVRNYWMKIATTNKQADNVSKLYGRKKTGAKGIGRFCCRRLGEKLKLETTSQVKNGFEHTEVFFNWNKFKPGSKVTEIKSPGEMTLKKEGKTSTKLIISDSYKDEWNPRAYEYVKRHLSQLVINRGQHNEGFLPDPGFNIMIEAEGTSLQTQDLRQEVLNAGWGTLSGKVDDNGNAMYSLNALNIGNKKTTIEGDYSLLKGIKFVIGIIPVRKEHCRDPKLLSKEGLNRIVESWGGVQIYLNNFRIYPYGDDDWLDIDKDRSLSKGAISENLIKSAKSLKGIDPSRVLLTMLSMRNYIGTVEISGDINGFVPKLNREGFLESAATKQLKEFVRLGIDWSTIYRDYFLRLTQKKEVNDAQARFVELSGRDDVDSKDVAESAFKYIEKEVANIIKLVPKEHRQEFSNITTKVKTAKEAILTYNEESQSELHRLRLISSTSILLLIFSHEVKALLGILETSKNTLKSIINTLTGKNKREIQDMIDSFQISQDNFWHLLDMTTMIAKDGKTIQSGSLGLRKHLLNTIKCFKLIIDKYKINIDLDEIAENINIGPILEAEFYAISLNLISNSIKAVIASSNKEKNIKIIHRREAGYDKITFVDNGIGLDQRYFTEVFIPFIKDPESKLYKNLDNNIKPEDKILLGSGTGLGLSIIKELLESNKGIIKFVQPDSDWKTQVEVWIK